MVFIKTKPSKNKCLLTKIKGGDALRTKTIEGHFLYYPEIGHQFYMVGKGLTPGSSFRIFNTSDLVEVNMLANDKGLLLITKSGSHYLIEAR